MEKKKNNLTLNILVDNGHLFHVDFCDESHKKKKKKKKKNACEEFFK